MTDDPLIIAGRAFESRLLVGSGKYRSGDIARAAVEASGAEIVTAALRRLPADGKTPRLTQLLDPAQYLYLPNSAGCYSAAEAVRLLRLAREAGGSPWVKLEVIGDRETLYPNMPGTFEAAKTLVAEGFIVLAYATDDPAACAELEQTGVAAVMPLAAPIGSGQGILNPRALETIVRQSSIPVIVDAGLGTASDAALAMEIGADAVLLNTALAEAADPVRMASAFRHAVIAGRLAFRAGRMPKRASAAPSSPAPDSNHVAGKWQ